MSRSRYTPSHALLLSFVLVLSAFGEAVHAVDADYHEANEVCAGCVIPTWDETLKADLPAAPAAVVFAAPPRATVPANHQVWAACARIRAPPALTQ